MVNGVIRVISHKMGLENARERFTCGREIHVTDCFTTIS